MTALILYCVAIFFIFVIMTPLGENNQADMLQKVMDQWDLINCLAARRFQKEETAEEAALYVLDMLARNNWQKLRGYQGRSKFSTYLSSIVYRLLEDYARAKFGRLTPPKWVKELGGIWLLLFRLFCLERFSFQDGLVQAGLLRPDIDEQTINASAEHLLAEIPTCGKSVQQQEYDDTVITDRQEKESHAPENRENELITVALGKQIFGEKQSDEEQQIIGKLIRNKLELKPEEQLLLKLRFREGLSIEDIGKMLGLNRFQINGRIRRTIEKIKVHFKNAGCEEELKLLLR